MLAFIIPLILGPCFILGGYYYVRKIERVVKNGIKTEGVIFDIVQDSKFGGSDTDNETPVVRFVTEKQEWITAKSTLGIKGIYTFNVGSKIEIIYNPDNPREFILANEKNFPWAPYIVLIIGALLTLISYYILIVHLAS